MSHVQAVPPPPEVPTQDPDATEPHQEESGEEG